MDVRKYSSGELLEKQVPRHPPYIIAKGLYEQTKIPSIFIFFIIIILVINIFLVVVMLLSKSMRSSSRHLLIISICIGDLIMGMFVLPTMMVFRNMNEEEITSCSLTECLRFFVDFLIPSVTTLTILALNIDYILKLYCPIYIEGLSRNLIIVALILVPWVSSFVILLPLYKMNLITLPFTSCSLRTDDATEKELLLLSFFPQAFLVLIFNALVSVLYLFNRESYRLDVQGERVKAPVDICLASFATLVLYTPVFLISLITTQNMGCEERGECYTLEDIYTAAIWAMLTKSWLMCLTWITCADTRSYIMEVLRCKM